MIGHLEKFQADGLYWTFVEYQGAYALYVRKEH